MSSPNQFSDRADPFGSGFILGYKLAPWAKNVMVSPFASFDFMNAPVNHTFVGGNFLGTTANFMGTAGVKVGPQLDMGLWLYALRHRRRLCRRRSFTNSAARSFFVAAQHGWSGH